MAIRATTTTETIQPQQEAPKPRRKRETGEIDLSVCTFCKKKLTNYVPAQDGHFCNDNCVAEYYA